MADVEKIESDQDSRRVDIKTNTQACEYDEEEWYGCFRLPVLDSIRSLYIPSVQCLRG